MKFFKTGPALEQGAAIGWVLILLLADQHLATLAEPIRWLMYFPVQACLWVAKTSGMSDDNANLFSLFVGGIFLVLYWYGIIAALTAILIKRRSKS